MQAFKNKWIYDPASKEPFALSRSRLEQFIRCPRCFYLLVRHGIKLPGGYPLTLNIAVDALFKKEFDIHRAASSSHPIMDAYGIDAVPFQHEKMDEWRENFVGIRYHHPASNLIIYGAVDDIWQKPDGSLIVIDYKATSTLDEVSWAGEWKEGYKRQLEIYQWLFRRNGFTVAPEAYLVYANAIKDKPAFNALLEFKITLLKHKGDDSWVEKAVIDAYKCLQNDTAPQSSPGCEYCDYVKKAREF
ncbi:MAG: PD-(D/E)XK nuclease family protein [Candidatus Margulisbacteria bacterium]|nr:PD-(D/E)XK nuclease family protein [Candidatus Margulisiibacteriota bacterium]